MAGAFWNGIRTVEIEATARILGIELDTELLDDVREMESAAAKVLNKRET